MANFQTLRQTIRRNLNLDKRRAILGTSAGQIYVAGRPGYVYVRERIAGGFSLPIAVRLKTVMNMIPGAAVLLGFDADKELAVIEPDFSGQTAQNIDPLTNNPGDSHVAGTTDLTTSPLLLSIPYLDNALFVTVGPLWYVDGSSTIHYYGGASGGVDLSSYVPGGTNTHLVAGIFLKTDDTLEIVISTAKSITDPIDTADLQECVDGSSAQSIPVAFWRLADTTTALVLEDRIMDGRQWINIPASSGGVTSVTATAPLASSGGTTPDISIGSTISDALVALAFKRACRVAAVANVSVSSAPSSIDGVTLTSGDRVLLTAQSTASENGPWVFNGAGSAMTRPTDYANGNTVQAYLGLLFLVTSGTVYAGSFFYISTTAAITIDTTNVSISRLTLTSNTNLRMVDSAGNVSTINGSLSAVSVTMPPSSTQLVGLSSTQIFTNKTFNDGTAINDGGSATGDLRVEGDTDDHLLFTHASTDRVGIGNATPTARLMVDGRADEPQLVVQANITQVASVVRFENAAGQILASFQADGSVILNDVGDAAGDFRVEGDTDANLLFTDASADRVGIGNNAPDARLMIDGRADEVQFEVQAHSSQTALLGVFEDSAGADQVTIAGNGAVVINEQGNDADTRIEGDTDANLFFADASTDRVGIGTNTPTAKLNIEGAVIINDNSADVDVRIESDGDANNFFSDGGNNNIGIGTGTPDASAKLQIISTDKGAIAVPVMTQSQRDAISSPATGLELVNSDRYVHEMYDSQRYRAVAPIGWQPYAWPITQGPPSTATSANYTLAANGGSCAVPIIVASHMLLESVSVECRDSATQRTWGWDLYLEDLNNGNSGENTLTRIASSSTNETFIPVGISTRTITATSAPVYLRPGVYWLVVQNRHATNAFNLGAWTTSEIFNTTNAAQTKTTTNPNGATLDFVAATWTKSGNPVAARLNGRVFGQTAAY